MKILKSVKYDYGIIPYLKSINVVIVGPDDVPEYQELLFVPVWDKVDSPISVKLPIGRIPNTRKGWDMLENNINRLIKCALSGKLMNDIVKIKDSDKKTSIQCKFTIEGCQLNNELSLQGF